MGVLRKNRGVPAVVTTVIAGLGMLAAALAAAAPAAAARTSYQGVASRGVSNHGTGPGPVLVPGGVKPGTWLTLGLSQTGPPELWRGPDNRDWAVWAMAASGNYSLAQIAPGGGFAVKPKPIITGWSGVSPDPTLLAHGKVPLLVFAGQGVSAPLDEGCIIGALPASPRWKVQSWSLSQGCTFSNVGYGDAGQTRAGVLSAAWRGRSGVPAGLLTYLKDLTGNGPVVKAPGSGTESVNFSAQPQRVAMASPIGHAAVYLAYCANPGTCNTTVLWKAGSKKTIAVPHGRQAIGLAMSAGPAGRLWLAWYNEPGNRVYVTRTNKADTRFGPLESYRVPCFADGNTHLALTGGSFGRVDVGLNCLASRNTKFTDFVTQAQTTLTLRARPGTIRNIHAVKVTFVVTDARDPVSGAKVKVDGRTLTTGKNGTCSLTFRKHAKPGAYRATAALADYYGASVTVHVKS